jgi:hypothetical protein
MGRDSSVDDIQESISQRESRTTGEGGKVGTEERGAKFGREFPIA